MGTAEATNPKKQSAMAEHAQAAEEQKIRTYTDVGIPSGANSQRGRVHLESARWTPRVRTQAAGALGCDEMRR